jgi:hypothetical protein
LADGVVGQSAARRSSFLALTDDAHGVQTRYTYEPFGTTS